LARIEKLPRLAPRELGDLRFSTALLVERLVDQLLRLGTQVDGAWAGVAAPLDHADEADIVGGVDPEPGAIDAEPVIGTDRRGRSHGSRRRH